MPLLARRDPAGPPKSRADLAAAAVALGLVALASVVGVILLARNVPIFAPAPPLLADWVPHLGPGTPLAVLVAIAVVTRGPELAARLPWRRALGLGYLAAVGWTLSLSMVDGWYRGVAERLVRAEEYLHEVPGVTDIGAMLRGFAARILDYQPDSWTVHVSGHPPGALLTFVGLDRIGLGGGAAAGLVCILVGAAVAVAVPVTLRALGAPEAARAALPFLVLLPGAVWVGVSADGLFAGVTATGLALVAVGASAARSWLLCLAGGVLLGFSLYLSYGLVLFGIVALAVLFAAAPGGAARWRTALGAGLGVAAVVAAFTLAGFWWLDGYHLVVQRYYQGIATDRPFWYWVWANLAALVLAIGPATAAGLRRSATRTVWRDPAWRGVAVVVLAAALAVLAADLSGLSKAEVERIWLPFAVWLVAGCALLPPRTHRWWLAAQALTALAVNHLLLTNW